MAGGAAHVTEGPLIPALLLAAGLEQQAAYSTFGADGRGGDRQEDDAEDEDEILKSLLLGRQEFPACKPRR